MNRSRARSWSVKRVYDAPADADGVRVLVDRLWPRGVRKETARVDHWLRDLAPSNALRQWYGHEPAKWQEFQRRYADELAAPASAAAVKELKTLARKGPVTLLFASRETTRNNAWALLAHVKASGPARPARRSPRSPR